MTAEPTSTPVAPPKPAPEPHADADADSPAQRTDADPLPPPSQGMSDAELEAMYLGNDADPSVVMDAPPPEPDMPSRKTLSVEEREAIAQRMLPEDVLEYFKEEFRGQFSDVRHIDDKPVY